MLLVTASGPGLGQPCSPGLKRQLSCLFSQYGVLALPLKQELTQQDKVHELQTC